MSDLNLGHGFVPRIDQSNYRALGRALGPRSLFDPSELRLPWVLLDGTWVIDNRDLFGQLESAGTRYLIDTAAWRFQHASAQTVAKLTALDHAPAAAWFELTLDDYRRFVAHDLRLQASLGAGAYFVPGLIPSSKDEDLSAYDEIAARAVEEVCFEHPLPAIATIGFHTQGLEIVRHRLGRLSGVYSAVYLQATPVDPYRDSASKLGNIVDLLIDTQASGLDVIAGRMGALTVPLRALGIAAADAGLATGESFRLTSKLRAPQRSPSETKSARCPARRPAGTYDRSNAASPPRPSTPSKPHRPPTRYCVATDAAATWSLTTASAAAANTPSWCASRRPTRYRHFPVPCASNEPNVTGPPPAANSPP